MTTTFKPAHEILPEYTDEALREERTFRGMAAKTLLLVPAEYRQAVEVESHRRCTKTTWSTGGPPQVEFVACPQETRHQVVLELLGQIGSVFIVGSGS